MRQKNAQNDVGRANFINMVCVCACGLSRVIDNECSSICISYTRSCDLATLQCENAYFLISVLRLGKCKERKVTMGF